MTPATATGAAEPEEGLSAMEDVLDISKVEVDKLLRSLRPGAFLEHFRFARHIYKTYYTGQHEI